jgi:hypothetical protein
MAARAAGAELISEHLEQVLQVLLITAEMVA